MKWSIPSQTQTAPTSHRCLCVGGKHQSCAQECGHARCHPSNTGKPRWTKTQIGYSFAKLPTGLYAQRALP